MARLTRERDEALEREKATAEVLRVISSSPGALGPVFEAMLENATRICEAKFGNLWLRDGNNFRIAATHGAPPAYREYLQSEPVVVPDSGSTMYRVANMREVVQIDDIRAAPDSRMRIATVKLANARSLVAVPMVKDNEVIGVLAIYRQEVRRFTDRQVALLANFAAQAVIAIENTRLLSELRQSLEQQTATADILRVISQSPTDARPVFDSIVLTAARLLRCDLVIVLLCDGATISPAAGASPEGPLADLGPTNFPIDPGVNFPSRAILDKKMLHLPDWSLIDLPEHERIVHEKLGVNSALYLPLLREGECIGLLTLVGKRPNSFGAAEIAQAESFRDQALIAIENTRLFNELRQSLEQQTATAEVLRVINSSPGQLEPVFQAMLESATRLCEAEFGVLQLHESGGFRVGALHNAPPAFAQSVAQRGPLYHPDPSSPLARVCASRDVLAICDLAEDKSYKERHPGVVRLVEHAGARTLINVPMLKDNEVIGVIAIYRQEVRPFTDKQIDLVKNFAAQAVIAIENTRLFNELRQRTTDLTESLQQQTATSDVLEVISRSAFDLHAVFEAVAESSVKLCAADKAVIYRFDGEWLQMEAGFNLSQEMKEWIQQNPFRPGRHGGAARAALERRTVHIPDVLADPEYTYGSTAIDTFRTVLGVPILKGDELLGVILVYHTGGVRPFTDKQIALVETFADQAAIAIENVRLLDELRERTDALGRSVGELRALGEVSQAVNSTLDLETVLSTIVAKAVELCGTETGAIYGYDHGMREFRLRATYGMDQELIGALMQRHIGFDEPNVVRAFAQREPIQIADLRDEAPSEVNHIILRAGYRARLLAPLLRGEEIVGMLVVRRKMPGLFTQNTVDLIKTFAAQSALAIQNARLFDNVETRTRELAKSLEDLRTAQDRLVQTEKLASLGQLTAGIAHEIKNPLNFVNNFSSVSVELIDELRTALGSAHLDNKLREEINEIADTLQSNLDKVVQHGKRADAIVKNMLLHSRQGSGDHRPVDVNSLVEESLNLAYHGARAEKQGFEITLERAFDPAAGEADLFPQEITRALLNLISNGFYAATKRKAEVNGGNYEPTLAAATKNLGDRVEIKIRDNGTGIPPEVKEKLFNPFFTTKPAGEGTGLGLSISHDIIVKQHGGSIEVDTQPGEFTEFRIVLPRAGASLIKSGEHP